jgi:hypothetical protein
MKNPRRMSYNNALELVRAAVIDYLTDTRADFEADDGADFEPESYDEDLRAAEAATSIEQLIDIMAQFYEDSVEARGFVLECLYNQPQRARRIGLARIIIDITQRSHQ